MEHALKVEEEGIKSTLDFQLRILSPRTSGNVLYPQDHVAILPRKSPTVSHAVQEYLSYFITMKREIATLVLLASYLQV